MPRPRDPLEEERVRRLLEKAAALRALRAWMQKQGPTQPPGPAQLEAERAASARYAVPPEEVAGLQERARRSPALAPLEFSREALGGLSTPFRREPLPYGATEPPPDRTAWRRFLPPLEEPTTIPGALGRSLGRGVVDPTMGEPLRGSLPEAVMFGLPLPTAGLGTVGIAGTHAGDTAGQLARYGALAARVKAPQAARSVAPTLKAMAREERGGARIPKPKLVTEFTEAEFQEWVGKRIPIEQKTLLARLGFDVQTDPSGKVLSVTQRAPAPVAPTPPVTKPVVSSETAPAIVKPAIRPPVPAGAESVVAKVASEAAVPTGPARAAQPLTSPPTAKVAPAEVEAPPVQAATGGAPPPVKPQLTRVSPYPRQELTQPLLRDLRVVQGGTTPNVPRPPVRDIPLGQLEPRPGPVTRPPEKTYTGPANVGAEWGEVQPRPPRRPLWAGTPEAVEAVPEPAATSGGTPPKLPSGRKPPTIGEPPEGPRPFTPEEDLAILEKAVNPPKPGLWERATDVGRRKKAAWVDSNDPLVPLQRETGLPVHDLAQLSADAGGAGEELVRTQVLPILKPVSRDLDSLELYMVAKRNEDIMGRNPSARLPGGLQGWRGTLQAQQALEKKLGAQRFKAIQEAADALYAADRKHNLDLLRDEGFLDDKALTQITSAHPHYIPFDRADFINAIEGRGGGPASISSTGLQRMGLEGSERALDKPLASFVQKFILTQERVARNRAAKTLVQSLEEIQKRTGEEMLQFVEPSKEMRLAERVTGEKRLLSKSERSALWEPVSYFENGQKVTVNVPAIYGQVAKGLNEEASNLLMKVGHYTTMPLRYGAIVYNPVWPAVNTIMNSTSAWFREGVIPLGPDFIRGIVASVKKDELFSEVAGKGILMRGFTDSMKDMTSMERATRQVRLGAIRVKSPKDAALLLPRLAALAPKGIERASIATEQATRIAAYRKLKREGVGEIERAVRAKEVTIDFSKMGTTMRTVNAVLPFTNAALQGTLLAGRTIVRKPKWAAIAASPFIAASVMARVNNQRFETSKDIPSYEYSRNWVFQFGEGTRRDGTKFPLYFKVPKGPLASGLTFPAEALFGYFAKQGDRSIAGTVLEAAWEGAKTVSPIEPSMNAVVPPPISTGVGLSLKKDLFTGQDIIPRREQNLLPEQQFGPETSRQAVALGKKFHVSPRLIDWAIKDYTAGTGEAVMALEDLGLSAIGYQPEVYGGAVAETVTPVEEFSYQPGVRRFFGTKGTEGERQGWNEFNKTVDETNRRFNEQFPEMNNLGLRFGSVGDSIDLVPGKKGGSVDMTPQERAEFQLLTEKSIQYGFQNATGPSAKATPAEQRAYWQKQMEADREFARLAMIEKLKRRILSGERVLTQKDRQELVAAK